MTLSYVLLSILWLALITYTVLGGADFGAGMLELFAVGPGGAEQDALIEESMDAVWESNHVRPGTPQIWRGDAPRTLPRRDANDALYRIRRELGISPEFGGDAS